MNAENRSIQSPDILSNGVGYNWFWFGPIAFIVLLFVEQHTIGNAWGVAKLTIHRWTWWGLISPSAAFCYSVTYYSVILPFQGVLLAKDWLADRTQPWKRIFPVVVLLVLLVLLPLITDTLIWGSFPFTFDAQGFGHLRLIPFIPWPSGGWGAL